MQVSDDPQAHTEWNFKVRANRVPRRARDTATADDIRGSVCRTRVRSTTKDRRCVVRAIIRVCREVQRGARGSHGQYGHRGGLAAAGECDLQVISTLPQGIVRDHVTALTALAAQPHRCHRWLPARARWLHESPRRVGADAQLVPRANLWRARHIHVAHRTAAPPCDELATRPQLTTPHSARGARVTSSPHGHGSVPRARHTTVLTAPPEISRSACDELVTRVTSSFCPVPRHVQHIPSTCIHLRAAGWQNIV